MFEIKGATFEVNGKPILNPIEHTFHEGKVYGLIGIMVPASRRSSS